MTSRSARHPPRSAEPSAELTLNQPAVRQALHQAGYADDPDQLELGLRALNFALAFAQAVADGLRRDQTGKNRTAGRNDPCPCGSGRKYKKCCQGRAHAVPAAWPGGPRSPLDDPALIPNLSQVHAVKEDLGTLAMVLEREPELWPVRFSLPRVRRFFLEAYQAVPVEQRATLDQAFLDQLALRYLREVEGAKLTRQLLPLLLRVAPRHQADSAVLRSLTLGGLLSFQLALQPDDAAPPLDLLGLLLFQLALRTVMECDPNLASPSPALPAPPAEVQARLGGWASDATAAGLPAPGPDDQPGFQQPLRAQLEELLPIIMQGHFPARLPLACLVPAVVAFAGSVHTGQLGDEDSVQQFHEAVAQLGEEDRILYLLELERIRHDPSLYGRPQLARLHFVRSCLLSVQDGIPWFGHALMLAGLQQCLAGLAAEASPEQAIPSGLTEVVLPTGEDLLSRPVLLEYAAALEHHGFPALAARTRRLLDQLLADSGVQFR